MSCETLLIGAYNTLFGSTGSVGYYAALDLFCVRVSERGGPKRWTQEAERKSKIHIFNPGRGHTLGGSKQKQTIPARCWDETNCKNDPKSHTQRHQWEHKETKKQIKKNRQKMSSIEIVGNLEWKKKIRGCNQREVNGSAC